MPDHPQRWSHAKLARDHRDAERDELLARYWPCQGCLRTGGWHRRWCAVRAYELAEQAAVEAGRWLAQRYVDHWRRPDG